LAEIKKVARRDPLLAAGGAVLFLERVSPALENVDGSSGAIGTAVNRAIADLVPIIADAPADTGGGAPRSQQPMVLSLVWKPCCTSPAYFSC
jgi:hypothetical protein